MPLPKKGPYLLVLLLFFCLAVHGQFSKKDLFEEANSLFEQGRYADAMPGFSQLLSLEPGNPEYNYKYGATALYGDPSKREEAIKYLRFATGKSETAPLAQYFLGRAYHLNYQFADAVQAYSKFAEGASRKEARDFQIDRVIETARNGQNLLNRIKDVTVLDKKKSNQREFFRLYDLSNIGGKILVTPKELLTSHDIKNNHRSLIHYRGEGSTVYFSSYGKDGSNGLDIYSAEVLPGGTFSEPKPLSVNINTPADEDFPYMHPDGKTFYFSSKGHSSMGGYDVFKSSFDRSSSTFGSPQNMDFAINTPDDDIFYIADSLNKFANFASGRSSKQGELHVYNVSVSMVPVELTFVKGTFANDVNPGKLTAKITVIDASTNRTVETQYTDPNSGDYLLSFPKSGRYKLLVEAQNSDRVHAGTVNIPQSEGVSAYLQEMELVMSAAIEKLIINNLFDQQYDGDIAALTRDMLRKRAELEVNFDASEPEPELAPEPESEVVSVDISLAYNEAGFGAGMTNEKVLADARSRNARFEKALNENRATQNAAAAEAKEALLEAREMMDLAATLSAEQNALDDGGKAAFEAAKARWDAKMAYDRAVVAADLEVVLSEKSKVLEARYQKDKAAVDELEAALQSGEYETVLAELKAENERLKSFDKVADRVDMNAEVSAVAKDARKEADRFMQRAVSMRNETEKLIAARSTKRKQAENARGKSAREAQEEVDRLDIEIADSEAAVERAFETALNKEIEAKGAEAQALLVKDLGASNETTEKIDKPETTDFQTVNSLMNDFSVDKNVVEAYLIQHPEALAAIGSGNELRAFAAETGVGTLSVDEAENMAFVSSSTPANPRREDTSPAMKDEPSVPDTFSADSNVDGADPGSLDRSSASVSDGDSEPTSDESVAAVSESGQDGFEPQNKTGADSSADALGDVEELKGSNFSAKIAEEQQALDAARDWIGIIDESIADLKADNGADDEAAAEQLADYKKLKAEKEAEVIERITRIESLKLSSPGEGLSASDLAAVADADLETLDAAYISRLESKINEASSTAAFVNDISAIMPGYIDDLEAIESSGKSAPEMAEARIALNESLIARLAVASESDTFPVSADRLTEIRRIKALEIREDEDVAVGKFEFVPRTAEAVAYAEMLAAAPEAEQPEKQVAASSKSQLSPELEESLRKPYSWDDIVPGYIDMMADETEDIKEPGDLEQRIEAHKIVLSKLKDDIDFYAVLASEGNTAGDRRIKQRYEQLLSERMMIVDVLTADRNALEAMMTSREKPEIAESFNKESSTPAENDAADAVVLEADLVTPEMDREDYQKIAAETDQFMNRLSGDLETEYTEIGAENTPAAERLSKLAAVNAASAAKISAELDKLTRRLDASVDDTERNLYQLQIQKLDALLADKLQESDRLSEESENATISSVSDFTKIAATAEPSDPEAESDLPETIAFDDLQIAAASAVQIEDFAFRSLQANMNGAKMEAAAKIASEKRSEAKNLMDDYAQANTPERRSEVYAELERVSREVKRADMELNKSIKAANAAEVNFYAEGSQAMISDIVEIDLLPNEKAELERITADIVELRNAIENNRDLRDELDAFDTQAYSAMLKEEMGYITRLQGLNAEIKTISDAVKARKEAAAATTEVSEEDQSTREPESPREDLAAVADEVNAAAESEESTVIAKAPGPNEEIQSAESETEEAQKAAVEDADYHAPVAGKTYMTSALQDAAAQTSAEERDAISSSEPEFEVKLDFSTAESVDERADLLSDALGMDPIGLKLLKDSPAHLAYLSTALIADSLKKIETLNAALTERTYTMAREREGEADRLRAMAARENNAADKRNIEQRAERIAAEAEVSYKKAAIAASRAEFVRSERRKREDNLAEIVKALDSKQVSALNRLLKTDAYTVITADLTGDERSENPDAEATAQTAEEAELPDPATQPSAEPEADLQGGYLLGMVEVIAERTDFSDVTETMFVMADRAVYSNDKPIPVDPEMPKGLIFQVQVGAFRKEIPQDHFGEIVPVMGQKLDNGITRYRAGLFKSYGAAVGAKDVIRQMGYSDAFVVAYLDGERLTGVQARDILAQARTALSESETAEVTPVAPREAAPAQAPSPAATQTTVPEVPDYYNDPEAAEAVQVEAVRGLFYTVQVGVYSKPVALGNLYNLTDLNSELTESGLIRYTTGRYSDLSAASSGKGRAVDAGVADAFVTAYFNGKRISLAEAEAVLEREGSEVLNISTGAPAANPEDAPSEAEKTNQSDKSESEQSETTDDGARYVIILGQFGSEVPQNVADFFLLNQELNIRRIEGPGGQSMYVSPEFVEKTEAERFLQSAKAAGISSALMGTVINGEIKALEVK